MQIAIFLKNWIGDTFFQFPAIRLIREENPDAKIVCIAPPRCRELLLVNPDISEVIDFDEKSTHRSWLKRFTFIQELRAKGPWDEGYLFHRSKTRAMLFALAGVKKRLGYGHKRGLWLTEVVDEPNKNLHHVDYFLELLRGWNYIIPQKACYELPVSDAAIEKAGKLLEELDLRGQSRFACFHLGANWEPKRWPTSSFAALADFIYDAWKIPVIMTGGRHDQNLFDAMISQVKRAKVFSLAGKTQLDTLGALYSQAAFVVSGDSGPLHVAAAVGAPVVALFGPTNPHLTGPRGKNDSIVLSYVPAGFSAPFFGEVEVAKKWLEHISPEQVFEEIQQKGWMA